MWGQTGQGGGLIKWNWKGGGGGVARTFSGDLRTLQMASSSHINSVCFRFVSLTRLHISFSSPRFIPALVSSSSHIWSFQLKGLTCLWSYPCFHFPVPFLFLTFRHPPASSLWPWRLSSLGGKTFFVLCWWNNGRACLGLQSLYSLTHTHTHTHACCHMSQACRLGRPGLCGCRQWGAGALMWNSLRATRRKLDFTSWNEESWHCCSFLPSLPPSLPPSLRPPTIHHLCFYLNFSSCLS